MTGKFLRILAFSLFFVVVSATNAHSLERKSRFATLRYINKEELRDFNEELYIGRSLGRMLRKRNTVTIEDEVMAKVDIIIEKAQVVLDMFPDNMHITVVILPGARDVAKVYEQHYGRKANHIAYYSLSEKTIYMSIRDTSLEVFSHEVGHAVVDHFFQVRPPYNIHELMAQFTAKHIED
ncbi:hypothetical protein [Desulfopila inferna]|uniref:hypothetical protein n=1 Tax=Desulfopila inferna TaxID=468528 RepID=UPI001965B6F9|nr:hypothetical protein [Desulfopila inferna]MBM9605813.1 hypothetical protein [Desulfopila inferna]